MSQSMLARVRCWAKCSWAKDGDLLFVLKELPACKTHPLGYLVLTPKNKIMLVTQDAAPRWMVVSYEDWEYFDGQKKL